MFVSREQAGEVLTKLLDSYKKRSDTVVVGIARGGVVVAKVIAQNLFLPFEIMVIKKIGAPNNKELAIGAIGPDAALYWDRRLIRKLKITPSELLEFTAQKEKEQKEKEKNLGIKKKDLKNKIVLLVDDGVATGATVQAAGKYLRKKRVEKIILVTPVISVDTYAVMKRKFHDIIAPEIHGDFRAVGQFYRDFPQVTDKEVTQLMKNV